MKIKRLLCLFLAFVLCTSVVSNVAFATDASNIAESPRITINDAYGKAGAVVNVSIAIENNPGILGMTLKLEFDETVLTLLDIKSGSAFSNMSFTPPKGEALKSGCLLPWDAESVGEDDIQDGIIATLSFQISETAKADEFAEIKLTCIDALDKDAAAIKFAQAEGRLQVLTYMPGDVNDDGQVTTTDVAYLRRYIAGGYNVTINEYAGDVNDDGQHTTTDVVYIRRYIAGGYGVVLKPVTPKCSHDMKATSAKSATCTEDGNIAYWYCLVCEKYFSDAAGTEETMLADTIVEKYGHTPVVDPAVAPTYTTTGLTEGSHCAVCSEVLVKQEMVPVLQKETYSITYNVANGDTYLAGLEIENKNPEAYTSEDGLVLQDIVVPGYKFKGWYTAQTGGTRVTEISVGDKGSKTLYAQWEKIEYTVTFDSPDVPVSSVTYTVDKGVTLTNPSWFGYTFVGWSNDNGFIVSSIKPGTTGNITLHANWTSNRNKATSYGSYGDPIIIEDDVNGQFLFVYDIGKIDNVPLSQIEYIGNTQSLSINKEYEITDTITADKAETIANTVSNATTRSSGWTLSEEWNNIYEAGSEYEDTRVKSDARTDSEGNVVGGNYFVSNSSGGSSYVSTESGSSSSTSSKVTTENSKGINESYDASTEKYEDAKLTTDWGVEGSVEAKIPVKVATVTAGINASYNSNNVESNGRKDNEAYHYDGNASSYVGTVNTNDSSSYYNSTASKSSTWNSTSGYEKSYQTSRNSQVSTAISEQISKTTSYNLSNALGGANSKTESVAGTDSRSDEYSTTIKYSEGTSTTTKKQISYSSDRPGYYRLVTAGTVHVFGVVGYDVATASYYTYTFNVLADETYEYLDYSKDNANFNDCENGVVTFEVPYEVNEFVVGVTGKTSGLEFDLDGNVTGFEAQGGFEGTVTVPQYYSVNNGDGTYSAYKTKSIAADAFKGNTEITTVVLPVYVTEIPNGAFAGCTNLETVIAYGVTKIGDNAFKGCTSLNKFSVDSLITEIGEKAFDGVSEIAVMAANESVADATINSGAQRITLNISDMTDSYDNKKIVVSDETEYFAFISDGASYSNLQIESSAKETFISNVKLVSNTDTPLKLNSEKVMLSRVTVENAPGFALILTSENTDLALFGTISLSSAGENAVISKEVTLSKANTEVSSKLSLTGNYLVCGEITNDKMLEFIEGEVITITEEEYNNYLTSSIVTFNANGGSVAETTKTVYYGQSYGTLPTPTRANYTFNGWYTAASGGTQITADTTVSALVNQTLYAQWKPNTFTLTYNANGGSVSTASKTLSFGDSYGTLPTPTRDYYTFNGWYTAASGGTKVSASTTPTAAQNVTIYAQWTINPEKGWIKASDLPEGAQITQSKWTYDLTSYTTSSSSSLSGWTQYNSTWVWSDYGSWSSWSNSSVASSDSRQVETKTIPAVTKTQYNYSRYKGTSSGTTKYGPVKGTWSGVYCSTKQERGWSDTKLSIYGTETSAQYGGTFNKYNKSSDPWYNETTRTVTVTAAYTQYRYRDRSKVYTYYYSKKENKESTSDPTGQSNVSNVVKYVKYREK